MTLDVDLYWSFRSPYSYLVTGRLTRLERDHDLKVAARVVLPLAVRDPTFFTRVDPLFARYVPRDARRYAEMLGVPFRWPRPDPVVQDMETREIAADQPYIWRISRLGIEAERRGAGLAFLDRVSRVIWDGSVEDWHKGDHLARAADAAGLELAAMDATISASDADHDQVLDANMAALRAAGHWGVPTMVFDGEPFFGQDRFELLVWRLKQKGLEARRR